MQFHVIFNAWTWNCIWSPENGLKPDFSLNWISSLFSKYQTMLFNPYFIPRLIQNETIQRNDSKVVPSGSQGKVGCIFPKGLRRWPFSPISAWPFFLKNAAKSSVSRPQEWLEHDSNIEEHKYLARSKWGKDFIRVFNSWRDIFKLRVGQVWKIRFKGPFKIRLRQVVRHNA